MGKFGQWLQVGANLGILAGLILVALQINQSNSFVQAQVTSQAWNQDMNLTLKLLGEEPQKAWTKSIINPDDLSDEDVVILDQLLHYKLSMIGHYREMENSGYGTNMDGLIASVTYELSTPFGRRWWQAARKRGYYKNIAARIEEKLATRQIASDSDFLEELKGTASSTE